MNQSHFAFRGFTLLDSLNANSRGDYPLQLLEWMAKHGMNRLELRDVSPEKYGQARQAVDLGRKLGIRVVPAFGHAWVPKKIFKAHPDWKAQGIIAHPSGCDLNDRMYCFLHPEVIASYREATEKLVNALLPDEVQFWCAEHYVHCECERCVGRNSGQKDVASLTRLYFMTQLEMFCQCVQQARKYKPDLGMSIWTTQGSQAYNEILIRSFPRDILWFYYDGERRGNYNLRRRAVIPEIIKQLRREGYRIGIQLDWASCGEYLPTPGTIREFCAAAADAELEGVAGWLSDYPFNLEADRGGGHPIMVYAAEMCRRPILDEGQSLARAMADAARAAGHADKIAVTAGQAWQIIDQAARTIHLADAYSYCYWGTSMLGAICERIIRRGSTDEIDQRWTDETWDKTIPEIDQAMVSLQGVLSELRGVTDATGYLTRIADLIELILAWAEVSRWVLWAGIVYHRQGGWDTYHGPWDDDKAELNRALMLARDALELCRKRWDAGHVLIRGAKIKPRRLDALSSQLDVALQAVERGAVPIPLERHDTLPY